MMPLLSLLPVTLSAAALLTWAVCRAAFAAGPASPAETFVLVAGDLCLWWGAAWTLAWAWSARRTLRRYRRYCAHLADLLDQPVPFAAHRFELLARPEFRARLDRPRVSCLAGLWSHRSEEPSCPPPNSLASLAWRDRHRAESALLRRFRVTPSGLALLEARARRRLLTGYALAALALLPGLSGWGG